MLTKDQLKYRTWLEETQEELRVLKEKFNGDTDAIIKFLISGTVIKLSERQKANH